jgi:eukaryotic-like serine/threonine-protein kinase
VAEEDGRPWIIMELVPSRSLDQVLTSDGPLPPRRACLIGRQLLAALAAAHAAGVLHRDVKPSNVLIADDPDGERAVLTDFGIAQFAGDPRLTQTGMVMGSPGFTAPERIRGGIATPASDLWSLGATLYAAVQGRGPYEERGGAITTMSAIINEDAPPASSAGPLGPLIAALLRRNPMARPTAASAARMFAGVLPLLPEVPRPARRTPTLASATVPASSPAGATSQDAVPDPGAESDGAAPEAAQKDAPPASIAEDATPAADEQAVSGQAAGDELAGDLIARDQADADTHADDAAAEDDGAEEDTGAENDSADDGTPVDQVADAEPAEAESDETESDDAEPVGTKAADTEAAGDETAGDQAASVDGAVAEVPRAAKAAAADGSAAEEQGPASADEAAVQGEARPVGESGPAGKAEAADEAEPVRHAAAASDAVPRQATPMGGAGMETPLLAPSWSWPEPDGAGDAAWSVRENWDPPTKPELSFGPPPLPMPRPRRGRRIVLAAAAVVLAAAIGTAAALLTRHTPAASGSTGGSSTTPSTTPRRCQPAGPRRRSRRARTGRPAGSASACRQAGSRSRGASQRTWTRRAASTTCRSTSQRTTSTTCWPRPSTWNATRSPKGTCRDTTGSASGR